MKEMNVPACRRHQKQSIKYAFKDNLVIDRTPLSESGNTSRIYAYAIIGGRKEPLHIYYFYSSESHPVIRPSNLTATHS